MDFTDRNQVQANIHCLKNLAKTLKTFKQASSQIWTTALMSSWAAWKATLAAPDGPKHPVQEVFHSV